MRRQYCGGERQRGTARAGGSENAARARTPVRGRFQRACGGVLQMMARRPSQQPPSQQPDAGRGAAHVPVLLTQVIAHLAPRDGGVYVDGTFGAGGYSAGILGAAATQVIGIDRDPLAIAGGQHLAAASAGRLRLLEGAFSGLDAMISGLGIEAVDGVVLDLGVSSMQLDTPGRGFSFRADGPLDMRMSATGASAADVVAAASERDLADIIYHLGEERHARGVARAIVAERRERPIVTTLALAEIVGRVVRGRPGDIHPATRTFQALRLFVNGELGELQDGLIAAERVLRPGGRLVVVAFHSLEDRIVKTWLASRTGTGGTSRHAPETRPQPATFVALTRRPVIPDDAETARNPRARSARLRAAERTAVPARGLRSAAEPVLPELAAVLRGRPS